MFFDFSKQRYNSPAEKLRGYQLQSMIQSILLEEAKNICFLDGAGIEKVLLLWINRFGEDLSSKEVNFEVGDAVDFILEHEDLFINPPNELFQALKPRMLLKEMQDDLEFKKLLKNMGM